MSYELRAMRDYCSLLMARSSYPKNKKYEKTFNIINCRFMRYWSKRSGIVSL